MNNQLLASDNFASGSLAAGWGSFYSVSKCSVVAGTPNVTEPGSTSTIYGQIWTGITWPNDQISECVNQGVAEANSYIHLAVRFQPGGTSGYLAECLLSGGGVTIYRVDSGVLSSLSSDNSVTFSAGDVLTFEAAGSCLSIYQNGLRLAYALDATYPSGYPGYLQYSSAAASDSQVSTWRGYSTQQQDGIWTKQQVVIPANATDLSGNQFNGVANASRILYEGNAQLLSGIVYKMWFSSNSTNIYYAESTDGINWTRTSSPVISSYQFPQVIKNGNTYYLYAGNPVGETNIYAFSSTDGVNWTILNSGNPVLSTGGSGGSWEAGGPWGFCPVYIDSNGTWHGLYTGVVSGGQMLGKLGYATSPDGINWTKYLGNPVATNFWNSAAIVNINGTWWMWGASNQPGQGGNSLDPSDTIRMSSPDLINWSASVPSIHHSRMFESLNSPWGQAFANSIIDIGGKAHLYYTGAPSDYETPAGYQIAVAVAPASIASIVGANEDANFEIASDNFTSGVGNLDSNWTTPTGSTKLQIVSGNLCEATATSRCSQLYTGAAFGANQYAQETIKTLSSGFANLMVLGQTGSVSGYQTSLGGPTGSQTNVTIGKFVSGSYTALSPVVNMTPNVGDVFQFTVVALSNVGNVLTLYQNGYLIVQAVDYASTFTSGYPGLVINPGSSLTNVQISAWSGGNTNQIPLYSWSPRDCRDFFIFPNQGITQPSGAVFYTGQTSDNAAVPGADSRAAGPPLDSRTNIPLNSRVSPNGFS